MGNTQQKTLSNLTAQEVQDIYASSVLTNMQNCGAIPSDQNVVDIIGDFNTATNINQYIQDGHQMNCTFQANNQQAVQDNLVAELTAKAVSSAASPINIDFLFGLLSLHQGGLLNETNLDVSSIQNSVSDIITSQVQNCNSTNCNPTAAGAPGSSGQPISPSACQGSCYQTDCSSGCGYANSVCIEGNFNSVSNITQNMDVSWVQNCLYSEATTQNTNNSLQASINAATSSATTTGFTLFGWVIFLAIFFIILGGLFILGRMFYRRSVQK